VRKETTLKVAGRCHCGRISYEAELDPERVSICHCLDCQTLSGSPYRVSVPVAKEHFRLLTGTPRTYVKTAESGNRRTHAFCGDCGAPVYSSAVDNPPAYSLRVGCLDQRALLPPKKQIWCRSAVPWSADIHAIAQTDRQ
jgi:hypothetical protein